MTEKKEEKKPKLKKRYVPCITLGSSVVCESIIYLRRPVFLTWNGEEFFSKPSIEVGDEKFLPLRREMYPYRPYVYNQTDLSKLNEWNLSRQLAYDKVFEQFNIFLDMEKEWKSLHATSTLESYEQHKISSLGHIFTEGDNDSGKTHLLMVHLYLDYRPLLSSNLPPADIFNYIGYKQEGMCTILEDEADTLSREYDREKLKIYRSGYKKDAICPRILDASSASRKQVFYKTFCSKKFGGRYVPNDRGFKQRLIPHVMVQGYPEKDEITQEDKQIMDKIKFGLLIWRMKNYWNPLPEIELELRGRTKELWKSKLQVIHGLEHENLIKHLSLASAREKAKKLQESLEAFITKALFKCGAQSQNEIPFSMIWFTLLQELDLIVEDKGKDSIQCPLLGYNLTKHTVGAKLRSIFSGESHYRHKLGRTWKFEKDKLDRLAKKFYVFESLEPI